MPRPEPCCPRVVSDARFAQLYGVDPKEAKRGAPIAYFFDGIHPDDRSRVEAAVATALGSGDLFSEEYRLCVSGEKERWVLAEGRCERDLDGRPVRFPGVSFDISDRKATELRLRELNADLERRVAERTMAIGRSWQFNPDLLCVMDTQGNFTAANPAFEKTLGWTAADVTSTSFPSFVFPDDLAATYVAWTDMVERGLPALRFENRWRTKSGGLRWISWVGVPEDDQMYCIGRDVTEQREHAQILAKRTAERDVLATIVETTDVFILVIDPEYRLLAVNKANADEFERVSGKRPSVGDSLIDLLQDMPEQRDHAIGLWRRALAGESFSVVAEYDDVAGNKRSYDIKFEVLRDADGAQTGAFSTSTEITVRLNEQRALADAMEALRQSQKMEAVGQLTGGIAHDFNNLLAAISGSLQVMRLRIGQGKLEGNERYIEMGERSVRRAATLTHRLLAFSRRQTLDPRPVAVQRLVEGMTELIDGTVGPSVQVRAQFGLGVWTILVDPSQLENALLNLCINARDAMPSGGKLTLMASNEKVDPRLAATLDLPPGEYLKLCVIDTGIGMSPTVSARVFEPFYTTKPVGQGTGLGLSMVFGFVRQSGGQIQIETAEGAGTTMAMYLPRHSGDGEADDMRAGPSSLRSGTGETILLIEDEETLRQLLREVLSEAGYTVLTAEDGPTGLRLLQGHGAVDLLLTDVGLPGGLNGRQVADAARLVRAGLKVLFITGYADRVAVGNGLMAEQMEIITKPFDISALTEKVRQMLSNNSRPTN